jgi:hypothetical protein
MRDARERNARSSSPPLLSMQVAAVPPMVVTSGNGEGGASKEGEKVSAHLVGSCFRNALE